MEERDLQNSINEYNIQLTQVKDALKISSDENERQSLSSLRSDLEQLIQLTKESLEAISKHGSPSTQQNVPAQGSPAASIGNVVDDEYALFMAEMAKSGAYDNEEKNDTTNNEDKKAGSGDDSDIEEELSTLLGMKCAVYHTHKWGGQPTLHNAMVCAVEPRQGEEQFTELKVRVLFTHPTHAEMLPCPFYLDGDCRFGDEQCRYSHGEIISLSNLKDSVEPEFDSIKIGSRVLVKLKPQDGEDVTLTKKTSEKYHLWHCGVVKSLNAEKRNFHVKLEHGVKSGEKHKSSADELQVTLEELFPLNGTSIEDYNSDDSLSDTDYPDVKSEKGPNQSIDAYKSLIIEKSLRNNGPAMGEWERHTRGIGSKLMFAMGYVAGTGLGTSSDGRLEPVAARVLPVGKSLDHCMKISEKLGTQDPLKVEHKLKRLQKKEEERNRKAYERERERERRNVFNFLNTTLGDRTEEPHTSANLEPWTNIRKTTSKDLNIEQFKITEEVKKVEKDVVKLKNYLYRHAQGSNIHKNLSVQLADKCKELDQLKTKEREIITEQKMRKDKQKLTLF